jgi:hypothetical protein
VFEGVVDRYRFETSLDGTRWTPRVASGVFDDIENNPLLREVTFGPVEARCPGRRSILLVAPR